MKSAKCKINKFKPQLLTLNFELLICLTLPPPNTIPNSLMEIVENHIGNIHKDNENERRTIIVGD